MFVNAKTTDTQSYHFIYFQVETSTGTGTKFWSENWLAKTVTKKVLSDKDVDKKTKSYR